MNSDRGEAPPDNPWRHPVQTLLIIAGLWGLASIAGCAVWAGARYLGWGGCR